MSETTDAQETGAYDEMLAAWLAAFRDEQPGRPNPYYRMLLIQAARDDLGLNPKEAMSAVDDYWRRIGLAIPQPSVGKCIVFGVIGAGVMLVPMALVYFLWLLLKPR